MGRITEVWNNTLESIKTEDNSCLMMMMMRKDGDDDDDDEEEEDDGDDGGWGLLAGVCLKYTSLPSSTEVTCDREFVINTSRFSWSLWAVLEKKKNFIDQYFQHSKHHSQYKNQTDPKVAHFHEIFSNF